MTKLPKPGASFYGHWRETLLLARELSSETYTTERRYIAGHSASILLSRTAMEIFLNEAYFQLEYAGLIRPSCRYVPDGKTKGVLLTYDNYISLFILDRIAIVNSQKIELALDEIALANRIRNYCIHYSADVRQQSMVEEVSMRPDLKPSDITWAWSPQIEVINKSVSGWAFRLTCATIRDIEAARDDPSAIANNNAEYCQSLIG